MTLKIPDRTIAADYHYYAYYYKGAETDDPWKLSDAQINRNSYQFYSMYTSLEGLYSVGMLNSVPNIKLEKSADFEINGNKFSIQALTFGGSSNINLLKPTVLFTGGIHAREWIAPAMTYLLAEYLIKNYAENPTTEYQKVIKKLVDDQQICIIPMLNPAGNFYSIFSSEYNARLWRKNRRKFPTKGEDWRKLLTMSLNPLEFNIPFKDLNVDLCKSRISYKVPCYLNIKTYNDVSFYYYNDPTIGVDCNRNFDTAAWGHQTLDRENSSCGGKPSDETYFGPNRNSESETLALVKFVEDKKVIASIDYHSYSQLILYPTERSKNSIDSEFTSLGRALQILIGPKAYSPWGPCGGYNYKLGTPEELIGYSGVSSVADYMASRKDSKAFTVELDPDRTYPGFKLPEKEIMAVFEKNIRGALGFIAAAGKVDFRNFCFYRAIMTTNVAKFASWNVFGRGNQLPP